MSTEKNGFVSVAVMPKMTCGDLRSIRLVPWRRLDSHITHITTAVYGLSTDCMPYEADFLVNAAVMHCMAPASLLKAAGVKLETKRTFRVSNGGLVEYGVGFARLFILGHETAVEIVLGPEESEPILGRIALDSLGIVVDPVT